MCISSLEFTEQHSPLLFPLLFITTLTLFITFLSFKWSPRISKKSLRPPSPPRRPIIGNLHQLGLHPHRSLQSLAEVHGPLMLLHFGRVPVLVVSSADYAREIMKTHDIVFANRPKSTIFEKLLYDCKDVAMAPYSEYWRQMKSLCVLHLLSNKKVRSFRKIRQQETANMINKIRKSCSLSSSINLSEIFANLTNDVVSRATLGRKYSDEEGRKNFKEMLGNYVELSACFNIGEYFPWLSWIGRINGLDARLEKAAQEFDEFLDEAVEEHMTRHEGSHRGVQDDVHGEDTEDFVDVLLRIQKENTVGFSYDRTSIKAIVLDVFGAGTDTTYTVLEWAMTELLRHPEVMKKVQNEVREVASDKSEVTEDDLDKLNYLKAVIKETLRVHPPIPLLLIRESTQDVKINGFDITARTQVIINAWAIGRDPALWDQAEKFRPERFLNSSIDFKGHDFQLIPFGAGRRGCPGIQFAVSVDELALANIVHNFDWALPGGARCEDLDVTESTGTTTHRKFPLVAVPAPYSC